MSLTDDWKAGKLKMGWYYVRFNCYKNPMPTYYSKKYNEFSNDGKVEEVLDKVPSYEELQEMKEKAQKYDDIKNVCLENEALELKVERLRDLLKECKPYISYKINQNKRLGFTPDDANLLTRINAAIGESEEK